jgi:hypothetical protein
MAEDDLAELRGQVLIGACLPRSVQDVHGHVTTRLPSTERRSRFLLSRFPSRALAQTRMRSSSSISEGTWRRALGLGRWAGPDVNSVVHRHPLYSVAVRMAGKTVFPIYQSPRRFGGPIPVMRTEG